MGIWLSTYSFCDEDIAVTCLRQDVRCGSGCLSRTGFKRVHDLGKEWVKWGSFVDAVRELASSFQCFASLLRGTILLYYSCMYSYLVVVKHDNWTSPYAKPFASTSDSEKDFPQPSRATMGHSCFLLRLELTWSRRHMALVPSSVELWSSEEFPHAVVIWQAGHLKNIGCLIGSNFIQHIQRLVAVPLSLRLWTLEEKRQREFRGHLRLYCLLPFHMVQRVFKLVTSILGMPMIF